MLDLGEVRLPHQHCADVGNGVLDCQAVANFVDAAPDVGVTPFRRVDVLGPGEVVGRNLTPVVVDLLRLAVGEHDVLARERRDERLEQRRRAVVVGFGNPDEIAAASREPSKPLAIDALVRLVSDDAIRNRRRVQQFAPRPRRCRRSSSRRER